MLTYFVYWFLIIAFSYLGRFSKYVRVVPYLLLASLIGFRKEVGTDYDAYTNFFNYERDSDFLEIGYTWINRWIASMGGNVHDVFLLMGLLSGFFIYKSLNNKQINYTPSAILSYIFPFSFLVNGIRQSLAISVSFFCYKYIEERKLFAFLLCIGFAFLFHNSIICMIPLFFFIHKYAPKKIYIIIFFISLILTQLNFSQLVSPIENLIAMKDRYANLMENDVATTGYFSIGLLFNWFLLSILFVFFLKNDYHKKYPVLFNLFFFSIIFFHMRIAAGIFIRVEVMFSWFQYLLLPIALSDKAISAKERFVITILTTLMYTILILNTYVLSSPNDLSPYKSIWSA